VRDEIRERELRAESEIEREIRSGERCREIDGV